MTRLIHSFDYDVDDDRRNGNSRYLSRSRLRKANGPQGVGASHPPPDRQISFNRVPHVYTQPAAAVVTPAVCQDAEGVPEIQRRPSRCKEMSPEDRKSRSSSLCNVPVGWTPEESDSPLLVNGFGNYVRPLFHSLLEDVTNDRGYPLTANWGNHWQRRVRKGLSRPQHAKWAVCGHQGGQAE